MLKDKVVTWKLVIPTSLSELINRIQKLGELSTSEDIFVEFEAFDNIGLRGATTQS